MSESPIQSFFQDENILLKSGVNPGNNASFLITTNDLKSKINENFGISLTTNEISNAIQVRGFQVLGATGYGEKTRNLEIVKVGDNLFGLNTESNTREVLSRYFQSFGYDVVLEFPDNVKSLQAALNSDNLSSFSKSNSRDLLAVKKIHDKYDIWIIELKGHSGVEGWDFFEGFKQIQRVLDFRTEALKVIDNLSIQCAFAVPGFCVKLHNGQHCYEKELLLTKNLLHDEILQNSKRNKKTYKHFFKSLDAGFKDDLYSNPPSFYFLIIKSINSVLDYISSKNINQFFKNSTFYT